MMTSFLKILTSLPFFQITAYLKQSGNRIPDAQSVKVIFSLIVTLYLTKIKNRTKKYLTQLSNYKLTLRVKVISWPKNADFLQKNANISNIKRALVLKGIFSKTTYICLVTCKILSFCHNSNEFQKGSNPPPPAPPAAHIKKNL